MNLLLIAAFYAQVLPLGSTNVVAVPHTPTLVQQTSTSTCTYPGVGPSFTCLLGSSPSAANVLILEGVECCFSYGSADQSPASTGATWVNVGFSGASGAYGTEIWCATLTGSPGSTVTVTLNYTTSPSANIVLGNVSEWSGTTCNLNGSPVVNFSNTGAMSIPTANLTTTNASDLLLATLFYAASSLTGGPSNSYTALNTSNASHQQNAYRVVSSTGTYSTTWTMNTFVQFQNISLALKSK